MELLLNICLFDAICNVMYLTWSMAVVICWMKHLQIAKASCCQRSHFANFNWAIGSHDKEKLTCVNELNFFSTTYMTMFASHLVREKGCLLLLLLLRHFNCLITNYFLITSNFFFAHIRGSMLNNESKFLATHTHVCILAYPSMEYNLKMERRMH